MGDNGYGETTVPAGLNGVKAVAAGDSHSVALKNDGTVVAWGLNRDNQATVPAGLSGVTAIDAGVYYTVALKSDGTVVAWGSSILYQTAVPAGLGGVTAIAAGAFHTVALKSDGTVVTWGGDYHGQTDVPVGLSDVTAITAGVAYSAALKSDGTVVVWGANSSGVLAVPAGLSGVKAIAAGGYHMAALKSDGTVVVWGANDHGQRSIPPGLDGVTAISAGANFTVALKNDGTVVAWGDNTWGQMGIPSNLNRVVAIDAGDSHTVALIAAAVPTTKTGTASGVTLNGARLGASVTANDADTTVTFEYGTTVAYGSTVVATPSRVSGSSATAVSATISSLQPHTTYHFRVVASNSEGTTYGDDATFKTLNTFPVAGTDAVNVHGATVNIAVLANDNDTDGDNLEIVSFTQGERGTVTQSGSDLLYTPGTNFASSSGDSFTYVVSDGFGGTATGEVRITKVNAAPMTGSDSGAYDGSPMVMVDVLTNDSDPDGDSCTIISFAQGARGTVVQSGSNLIYTPGEGFFGNDTFNYTVSDGFGGTAVGAVNIHTLIPITAVAAKGATTGKIPSIGDPVPGELTHGTFKTFGVPAIDDAGRVAFLTTVETPLGNVPAVFDGTQIAARRGDAAPGLGAVIFDGFTDPALNGNGVVAFLARLRGEVTGATNQALYTTFGGTLVPVVRKGGTIPGVQGAKLSAILAFQLLDEAVLFLCKLNGVPASSAFVLCSWTPSNGVQVLLQSGASIGGNKVRAIAALLPAAASTGQGRNASTTVKALARVTFTNGTQGVVEANPEGVTMIAQTAGVLPGEPAGTQWKSFGVPAINRNGDAAFLATLAVGAGGVTKGDDMGLFAEVGGNPLALVAREGQSVGDAKLSNFSDPVQNADGGVAALANLAGTGVTGKNNRAILFAPNGESPVLLARTGDEPPGIPGAKWKAFQTLALPDGLGPVFLGKMMPRLGGVSTANDAGLWATDGNGEVHLLVREGDNIEVAGITKAVKSFTVLAVVPGSPGQTRAFNRARQLVYRATFMDGSQAIVRVQMP
ncbi:DUF7453 family protein [Verrucomicrobiota bacterium sgz303538]